MQNTTSLPPCPDSPNCVSSQSANPEQYIEPFSYSGTPTDAKAKLHALFKNSPRSRIVVDTATSLRVEITSLIFRFIDDVEFLIDDEHKLIHLRSASRTGYWDLGVNRKRMETLRIQFQQLP
ncbi:DUF1499 domain-containing protein [Nitrospira sp. M1]